MWVGAITGSPHRAAATVRTRAGSAIVTPPGCASRRWPCMSPVLRLTTMRSRWAVSTHNGAAAEAALPADGAVPPADVPGWLPGPALTLPHAATTAMAPTTAVA